MLTRLATILVAIGPGGLLAFVLPRGRYRWVGLAAAPVLTLGLCTFALAWLPVVGLPNGPAAVLVGEMLVAGAAVLASELLWRRGAAVDKGGQRDRRGRRDRRGPLLPGRADLLGCGAAVLVCLAFGYRIVGRYRFPPGWDAMNHAVLTRNMMEAGSTAMTAACTTGSTAKVVACEFYPHAVDVSWAQAATLSGGPVSTAMVTWAAVIGPLILAPALYAAVRVLGGRPFVAAGAAALPAVLGPFFEQQLLGRVTGGIPGLSITVALLVVLALKGRFPLRCGLLAGLALAGLVMSHTYDVLFAGTLALAFLLTYRGRMPTRPALLGVAATGAATLAAIGPLTNALLGASGERVALKPPFAGQLGQAVHFWVTDVQRYVLFGYPVPGGSDAQLKLTAIQVALWLTVPCLILSPLCFVFSRLRWARPWVALGALWTAIGIWTSVSATGPAASLAHLWYGNATRVRDMIFPIYPMLAVTGACGIGLSVQWMFARITHRERDTAVVRGDMDVVDSGDAHGLHGLRGLLGAFGVRGVGAGPAAAVSVLVVACLVLGALPRTSLAMRKDMAGRTTTSAAYPRVFSWLDQHTPPGAVVAYNRNFEFWPWVYGDDGVGVLFGIPAFEPSSVGNYNDRWRAWKFLTDQRKSPDEGCLVRRFNIVYVLTARAHYPARFTGVYRHDNVATSPYLRLVHQDRGLDVYEVNAKGRACATA